MTRLRAPLFALGFLTCSALAAQPEADKKLEALEKMLSVQQKRLFHDYAELQVRTEARHFDPTRGGTIRTLPEVRGKLIDQIAAMSPEQAKVFWRDLPYILKRGFRDLDRLHVSAEEREEAARLPAAAKEQVEKLLSDQFEEALTARRKILAHGPACRALVADQLARLPADSPQRLRHEDLLAEFDRAEAHERRMRIADTALHRASQLEKARKKATSTIAVLLSRRLCDLGARDDPYGTLCYYNFFRSNHEYRPGVGLEFGNGPGNRLQINFWRDQDNRMISLGDVKFAEVKKAPGPETTAKWWKGGLPMTAVVGHVYLLHVIEPRDRLDFTVKFQVLDLSPDEWIIIQWELIPQEN
jgi:hypothetical protein